MTHGGVGYDKALGRFVESDFVLYLQFCNAMNAIERFMLSITFHSIVFHRFGICKGMFAVLLL
jgi:hypothetical protein